MKTHNNRRQFMKMGLTGSGAMAFAMFGGTSLSAFLAAPRQAHAAAATQGSVLVGDVVDHALSSNEWPGAFGYVTFKTHEAIYRGSTAYFIRTDASDASFAEHEKLVHVPLLNSARDRSITNDLFVFEGDQLPVIRYAPGDDGFTPLFEIKRVSGSTSFESAEEIDAAQERGELEVTSSRVLVNYPLISWPGGGLTVDDKKAEYLGDGQLIRSLDEAAGTVTLKLHEAFPGSYYILTDASLAGPAEMMNVPVSAPTWELNEHRATDKVWVFVNGIKGSGAMGFQPAIFGHQAGHPAWSPFWDHYALEWRDTDQARLLTSADAVRTLRDGNVLKQYNGVPPTDPQGFVVNCPVPVVGPNHTTE